jgi:acyl-CoA thioesterase-1
MNFLCIAVALMGGWLAAPARAAEVKTILFFGDSITAGYGLTQAEAYPALVQAEIDALHWPFRVVNAGLSGDTTGAGIQRLRWVMKQKPDVLVIALGGNDGLRGLPPETTRQNIQTMIDQARAAHPPVQIILAGMKMPANYGKEYNARFAALFPALAQKNRLPLIPFLLEGVGGVAKLNLPDRIHPTAQGHRLIAQTVWKHLKPRLQSTLDR